MIPRVGNDVLRAVALLAGLIVVGSILFAVRDDRVAQFGFDGLDLGRGSAPVSIALDARDPARLYASGGAGAPAREGWAERVAVTGDLATDGTGTVYAASPTRDGIEVRVVGTSRVTRIEAQQLTPASVHAVARADGLLVVSALQRRALRVWTSSDSGKTFVPGGEIPSEVAAAGPVVVGPFGSLFAAVVTPGGLVGVAASADGGLTWSARGVKTASGADRVAPALAVDDAATFYVAWTQTVGGRPRIVVSHSLDVGIEWSEPLPAAPFGTRAPQLIAGSQGRLGLAYLDDEDLVYRYTSEALERTPFWTEHLVARQVHCGRVCDRAPYELTTTTQSRALLVALSRGRVVVTEQVSGQGVR